MRMNRRKFALESTAIFLGMLIAGSAAMLRGQSALPKPDKDTVLKASDIKPKLFPDSVFFRGQTAPTQLRNTGGIHFTDDLYVLLDWWTTPGIRQEYAKNIRRISSPK